MEGQFFVEYLGSSTLPKGTTGLGLIQKPLREYYTAYHKSPQTINVQEVTLRLSPRGIAFIFRGDHSGQNKELFYDMSSIIYIEAVKFTVSKGTDKKVLSGFLPIDESRLPVKGKDKIFYVLDKKQNFLTQIDHPPLLTCVMRRTSGVKSLDCHVFVIGSMNDALRIVAYVESVQRGQSEPIPRSDSEKYGRPEGLHREPAGYWGRRDQRTSDDISDGVYSHEIRRDNYYEGRNRYSDGPGVSEGLYSQEIRRDNYTEDRRDRYSDGPGYYPGSEQSGVFYGNIRDRRERGSGSDRGSQNEPVMRNVEGNYVYPNRNRSSGELPGQRNGYGNDYVESSRSPRDPQFNVYSDRIEMRDPHERADNYRPYERRSGDPRAPPDQRPMRAMSPGRHPRSPVEPQRSPRLSAGDSFDEPVYSASNMENRKEFEKVKEDEQRRFGKLPPHMAAGVKVLPSVLPVKLKKAQSPPPVKKKPTEHIQKTIEHIQESSYIEDEDPYDNYVPREGYYYYDDSGKKQILSGSGWKDDKEDLYGRRNDVPPDVLPRHEQMHQFEIQREKNQFRNQGDQVYPSKTRNENRNNPTVDKPWTFDDQIQQYQNGDHRKGGKSPTETGFIPAMDERYKRQDSREKGKDAEIESMFSYLHVDHSSTDNLHTGGENFEKSLGYFP